MKITRVKTSDQALNLMRNLNYCHDASVRKICFMKKRELDRKTGSLIYPFDRLQDRTLCDVHVEMLLNSYLGAKRDQTVLFKFVGVSKLALRQGQQQDYSDVYEVGIRTSQAGVLEVSFYSTEKKVRLLSLSCLQFVCREL